MSKMRNIRLKGNVTVYGCVNGVTLLKELSEYIKDLKPDNRESNEPIYISRGKSRRQCVNEEEVEEIMKEAGIKCVDLSELSILEQFILQ